MEDSYSSYQYDPQPYYPDRRKPSPCPDDAELSLLPSKYEARFERPNPWRNEPQSHARNQSRHEHRPGVHESRRRQQQTPNWRNYEPAPPCEVPAPPPISDPRSPPPSEPPSDDSELEVVPSKHVARFERPYPLRNEPDSHTRNQSRYEESPGVHESRPRQQQTPDWHNYAPAPPCEVPAPPPTTAPYTRPDKPTQPQYEPQPSPPTRPAPPQVCVEGWDAGIEGTASPPWIEKEYTGREKCAVFCIILFYFCIATAAVATNMLKGSVESAFFVLLLCPGVVWLTSHVVCALADSDWSYRDPTALIFFLCIFFLVYGLVLFGVGLSLPDHGEYTILKEGLTGETDLVCHAGEMHIPPYDAMLPENYYILEGTWSVDWENASYVETDDGVFATAVVSHVKGDAHCKLVPDMTAVCQGSNRTYADECVANATRSARDVHVRRLQASTKMTPHLEDRMRSLNVGKLFEFDSPSAVEVAEWLEDARLKWKVFMGWTCAVWVTITFCALIIYFCTDCCDNENVEECLSTTFQEAVAGCLSV